MKASSISRRARGILVTAGVVAMGLSVVPATAAQTPPPQVRSTSLSAGDTWSRKFVSPSNQIVSVVSVDYNQKIDVTASSITVTDGAGLPVAPSNVDADNDGRPDGIDTAHVVDQSKNPPQRLETDQSIYYFIPGAGFTPEDGPYTATFTARALNQVTGSASTVTRYTFRVDLKESLTPAPVVFGAIPVRDTLVPITDPAGARREALPKSIVVLQPGESAKISGLVKDAADDDQGNYFFASGIQRIEARFFSGTTWDGSPPTTSRPLPLGSGEAVDQRVTLLNTCAAALCPEEQSFQFTKELPTGAWSVRLRAYDLAGNVSGESSAISIIVAKAP